MRKGRPRDHVIVQGYKDRLCCPQIHAYFCENIQVYG